MMPTDCFGQKIGYRRHNIKSHDEWQAEEKSDMDTGRVDELGDPPDELRGRSDSSVFVRR